MSNPNDPNQPSPPDQSDPNAKNPQSDAPTEGGYRSGGSSFEFQLPDEGSEPLPIPEPDANVSRSDFGLPPIPEGAPGVKSPFGSRGSFGDFGLEPQANNPAGSDSADGTFLLPDLPPQPHADDSAVLFDPTASLAAPGAAGMQPLEPANLPDVSSLYPPVDPAHGALPDIPARAPSSVEIDLGAAEIDALGGPLPIPPGSDSMEIPIADLDSSAALGGGGYVPLGSDPDIFGLDELPLADADPADISGLDQAPGASGGKEGESVVALGALAPTNDPSSFSLGSVQLPAAAPDTEPSGSSGSVPDVKGLFPTGSGSSGSTPSLPSIVPPGYQRGGSSFEFQLPEGVDSVSDLPPIPGPDANESNTHAALPPKPIARPVDASFDFINVSGSRSLVDIGTEGKVIAPAEPDTPPPAVDSKVPLGDAEPIQPVKPASGWLDSGTNAEEIPAAELVDAGPEVIENSNIFTGAPVPTAEAVDAEIEIDPEPLIGAEQSDVALTFDPADDGTMQDGGASDLLVAAELADGGTEILDSERVDAESIHDMPAPALDHQLFDSATLAHTPDLPGAPHTDATDYGANPAYDADASSILADHTEVQPGPQDESSVRVEAPGVDRTLSVRPADGFDLTVSDEPVPAGLFDDAEDAEDWRDQSGSNLLDQDHTAPEFDLEDLVASSQADDDGPPSLSSAPSSIFSGLKSPFADSGNVDDSAGAKPGSQAPPNADDVAEFTDEPELDATVVRPKATEPDAKRSSANFQLPDADSSDGSVDWGDAALAGDEDATRAARDGVSLSSILRGELPDDSAEMPTRSTGAIDPSQTAPTREPVVSVDWLSGSAEGSAVSESVKAKPGTKEKGKDKDRKAAPAPTSKTKPNKDSDAGTGSGTSPVAPEKKDQAREKGRKRHGRGVAHRRAGGRWRVGRSLLRWRDSERKESAVRPRWTSRWAATRRSRWAGRTGWTVRSRWTGRPARRVPARRGARGPASRVRGGGHRNGARTLQEQPADQHGR